MTTTARSATRIKSKDTPSLDRPTSEITIGEHTFPVRAPKYQIWLDVAKMLERNQLAGQAMQQLTDQTLELTDEQREALAAQIDLLPAFGAMEEAIIYGQEDATGRVHGGFLRRCMKPEDWQQLLDMVDDDDSDVDLPDLYHAALLLQEKFTPWFEMRSATMGLPTPTTTMASKPTRRK